MNSFFWTTSFFSDTFKIRLHSRIVNNKKQDKCFKIDFRGDRCTGAGDSVTDAETGFQHRASELH